VRNTAIKDKNLIKKEINYFLAFRLNYKKEITLNFIDHVHYDLDKKRICSYKELNEVVVPYINAKLWQDRWLTKYKRNRKLTLKNVELVLLKKKKKL